MKRLFVAAVLLATAPAALFAQSVTPAITAALADAKRPADQKARDAARHAGDIIAFAGIKPGMKVADFMMGGGYWTRILSPLVGPKGHVYAYQAQEFIAFKAQYGADQDAAVAGYANVTPSRESLGAVTFPEKLDAIVTVQNYHDLYLKGFPAGTATSVAKRLYDSLKPGGTLLVIDHVAASDPGLTAPDKLHRIDPAVARAEIEKAGFKFDGESKLLVDPADTHQVSVFDPSIRGKTDQFVFRFKKPA